MNPFIRRTTILPVLIGLTFVCFGLLPQMQALSPPPDGCYPNYTTAEGCNALSLLTTGAGNTGFGWYALFSAGASNFNTAVGGGALALNTADSNTAVGAAALLLNTTGNENTAVGTDAMVFNDSGALNTAVGGFALFNNGTGTLNTAIGDGALRDNIDGSLNTAVGGGALSHNLATGLTAVGGDALFSNTSGTNNTAVGTLALSSNTIGSFNTASGDSALHSNTEGSINTAIGQDALYANTTGIQNTALGVDAGGNATTGNGNVYIGYEMRGAAGESNHTYIKNINDTTVSGGGTDTVTVSLSTGLLGHLTSSRRYKENIKPMNDASTALYRLQPVSYRYKKEIDATRSPAFGLIAEDVAAVNPALVARNAQGQPESVHYEMVNAMLLNEFLKEHRKVQELEATVARQHEDLEIAVTELKGQIRKVTAQLELSKTAPQTVLNRQ
jgi:hypothetical protein